MEATSPNAPATDTHALLIDNLNLFRWYAKRRVPPECVDDVTSEAVVIYLRNFDPTKCKGLAGFVRVVVMTAIQKYNRREVRHLSRRHHPSPLEGDVSSDGTEALADRQRESEPHYDELAVLDQAVCRLNKTARAVLTRRFGLCGNPPETLQEIADSFGVSKAHVGQVAVKAMKKLRRILVPTSEAES